MTKQIAVTEYFPMPGTVLISFIILPVITNMQGKFHNLNLQQENTSSEILGNFPKDTKVVSGLLGVRTLTHFDFVLL